MFTMKFSSRVIDANIIDVYFCLEFLVTFPNWTVMNFIIFDCRTSFKALILLPLLTAIMKLDI